MPPDLYIEIFGALAGMVYVWLEILKHRSMWVVGIVTSVVYIYIFAQNGFYAMAGLNLYYVAISVYGLWNWKVAPEICRIGRHAAYICLLATVLIFLLLTFALERFTNAPLPYADALITAMSIVATWMLARSYLEQWWVWIVANLLAAAVYGRQGLYPTAVLYVAYMVGAVVGLIRWRRKAAPNTV